MNELFNKYLGVIRCSEDEICQEFLKIYQADEYIEEWLDKLICKLDLKNDEEAGKLRCQGNILYASNQFKQSFDIYTKAMRKATISGSELGLIVANRSALLFMMNYFEDCLKDIEFSLKCTCSDKVKMKLYVRKIKCFAKMNLGHKLEEAKKDALEFLEKSCLVDKDARKANILSLGVIKTYVKGQNLDRELPSLTGGFNSVLPGASTSIKLSYDKACGRHVIANEDIEVGDVLFVEKPFVFAPIFVNDNMEMLTTKCYNCLKTVFSSIPCDFCTKIIYCDEHCRGECWEEFHRWECFGMQCNLWYQIGIGFPAFRAVVKRMLSKENVYSYFNQLVSNLSKMENVLPLIISAGVIVCYLMRHTTFFDWISTHEVYCEYTQIDLIRLIGGTITKHIAQLQCNSSLIEHVSEHKLDEGGSIACGIYPSISMMNHSCSSNVQIRYTREVAVARASESIAKGEEVCNCYGIDYRFSDRKTRQEHCRQYYYFECCCRICKFSKLEIA